MYETCNQQKWDALKNLWKKNWNRPRTMRKLPLVSEKMSFVKNALSTHICCAQSETIMPLPKKPRRFAFSWWFNWHTAFTRFAILSMYENLYGKQTPNTSLNSYWRQYYKNEKTRFESENSLEWREKNMFKSAWIWMPLIDQSQNVFTFLQNVKKKRKSKILNPFKIQFCLRAKQNHHQKKSVASTIILCVSMEMLLCNDRGKQDWRRYLRMKK